MSGAEAEHASEEMAKELGLSRRVARDFRDFIEGEILRFSLGGKDHKGEIFLWENWGRFGRVGKTTQTSS